MSAECHFHILNRDDPDNSRALWISNNGGGWLTLDEPPQVGDLIALSGEITEEGDEEDRTVKVHGVWKVLARCWEPASWGSMTWPYDGGKQQPSPVSLMVMLERVPGIFDDSHYAAEED